MKIITYLLIVLLGLALSEKVSGQSRWSFNDCVRYSLKNSRTLKIQNNETRSLQHDLRAAKASYLPSLNGSVSASKNFGRSVDPETNAISNQTNYSNNMSLYSQLVLFQGFYRFYQLKGQRYALMAGVESEIVQENNLVVLLAESYFRMQYAMERAKASASQVDLSKKQLYRVEKMVEVGKMSEVSKLEMQSQYSSDSYSLLVAQNEVENAKNELYRLMNYNDVDFEIEVPSDSELVNQLSVEPSDVYNLASERLPKIKALEYQLKMAEYNISLSRSGKLPSLSLSAGVGSGYNNINSNSYKDQLRNNQNEYVSASLSVPVFNRFSNQTSIKKSKLRYDNQRLELEQTKIDLLRDIEKVCLDYNASLNLVTAAKQKLELSELTFREMQRKFEVGLANSTELFSMKTRLLDSQNEASKARIDFEIQKLWLKYYQTGRVFQEIDSY